MADIATKLRSSILIKIAALNLAVLLACSAHGAAQETASSETPAGQQIEPGMVVDSVRKTVDIPGYITTGQNEGKTLGDYEVRQTVELGGRVADWTGSRSIWSSYVNVDSG